MIDELNPLMKKLIFTSLFFISFNLIAQVVGESIYQFLNLPTAASQVGLGGETLTLLDDINQPQWNPAVIDVEMDGKFSFDYTNYLAGISIGSVSYARTFSRRFGTLHGSIKYLNYGTLIGADEEGNETGNFGANDIALSVGYSRNLPWTDFYFGANLKIISSNIDVYSSFGIASDISVLYKSPYKPYVITVVARNLGLQLKSYNGTTENLPFKLAIGGSYQLEYVPLKWHVTIDNLQQWDLSEPNPSNQTTDFVGNTTDENITFLSNAIRHLVIGAELFPESLINIRVGYNFKRAKELELQNLRTFSGISFGFGVQMNKFKFNYAFSKVHSASNVSTFGLQIDLNNSR